MRLYLNIFKYNVYEFKEHCSVTLSKQYLVNAIPQKKCKFFLSIYAKLICML